MPEITHGRGLLSQNARSSVPLTQLSKVTKDAEMVLGKSLTVLFECSKSTSFTFEFYTLLSLGKDIQNL